MPSCTFIGQQATLSIQEVPFGTSSAGPTTVQAGSVEFNGFPTDIRFSVDVEGTSVRMFNTSYSDIEFAIPTTVTISVSGSQTITGINSVTINGVTDFMPQDVSFTSNSVTLDVTGSGWNAETSVVVELQLNCSTDTDNDGIPDTCDIDQNPGAVDFDRDGIVDSSACDTQIGPPTNREQCKSGGWSRFNSPRTFRNQGDCIQFVNTGR